MVAGRKNGARALDIGAPLWLSARVHAQAFRLAPLRYLVAAFWWCRGYRVRARNYFSSLLGQAPAAYQLWIRRVESKRVADRRTSCARQVTIVPVIDCTEGRDGLDETLGSLGDTGHTTARPIVLDARNLTAGTMDDMRQLAGHPGVWFCLIRPGDRLATGALWLYSRIAERETDASLIYADDDLIDAAGRRSDPHFKPDWNPELFEHHDFITGACIFRANATLLDLIAERGLCAQLVADAVRQRGAPVHVREILHHRRARPGPRVPANSSAWKQGDWPSTTVIVPTRNKLDLLRTCVDGVSRTSYPALHLLIIDNGSDEPDTLAYLDQLEQSGVEVLRIAGPFNYAAMNNAAAAGCASEYLCFLNNDVEILETDWLRWLVQEAVRPDIGAVGARLLYPDHSVQHAGVVIGMGQAAGHAHRFERQGAFGYFARSQLPQRVSAVTAACLVVAREKFLAVGGFDEVNFPVAFNDVDLCLRLNERGWQSYYEPRATLIHHESKSRGKDKSKAKRARFAGELEALKRRWRTDEIRDPFHHPDLSRDCEQFVIAL